jgi:2-amino-4-hydroxy-6-hydroxymethyldihydropteridine diphosphokinase
MRTGCDVMRRDRVTERAHTQPEPASLAHEVYLGLGSNLGDRDALLRAALDALSPAVALDRVSSVYDTAPMLLTEQPRFHNVACAGSTALAPYDLLRTAKDIEAALGRAPGVRYGPRPIDIDILLYDGLVLEMPDLVIPHPGIAERAFVLFPLCEIAPELVHPVLRVPLCALAEARATADVRRVGPLFPRTA